MNFFFVCFDLQETMEDIDKNGDGFIDLDEYIGKLCVLLLLLLFSFKVYVCI